MHYAKNLQQVLHISLSYANGLELNEMMSSRYTKIPFLIFSSHDELSFVEDAFRAGARVYVVKSQDTAGEIVTAIRQIHIIII